MAPVLVISDIHGNFDALKAVFSVAAGRYEEIWVLGDIAGYGPDPEACITLLKEKGATLVAGNHDLAASGLLDLGNFNAQARGALEIHKQDLSAEHKAWLGALPSTLVRRSVTLVHGSLIDPVWGYIFTDSEATRTLERASTSLTLCGHSHMTALWRVREGRVGRVPIVYEQPLSYKNTQMLANPGSVGQSRDGDPAARYMILHPERKILTFGRQDWSSRRLEKKMRHRGYPPALIARMSSGH